jgi:hypothetical protein
MNNQLSSRAELNDDLQEARAEIKRLKKIEAAARTAMQLWNDNNPAAGLPAFAALRELLGLPHPCPRAVRQ